MTNQKRAGVITLEITLEKPISRQTKVVVELAWNDMTDLLATGDNMMIDRAQIGIDSGPADDATIINHPESLQDFTWKCTYPMEEWSSAENVARMMKNDRRVLSARAIQ